MSRPRILISGGTGFLGTALVPLSLAFADVTLISRSKPGCLKADLTFPDGGIDARALKGKFDIFLHMAGLYDLRVSRARAHAYNVVGTRSALSIAAKAEIPNFVHISTVGVGIRFPQGEVVPTDYLNANENFPDHYAATKAQAEQLVRDCRVPTLKSKLILRPGALVGDRREGKILRIDGPYHTAAGLHRMIRRLGKFPGPLPLPGRDGVTMPIVPVDVAADTIARLVELSWGDKWNGQRCFHLVPGRGLSARELYASTLKYLGHEGRSFSLLSALPDWLVKPATELFVGLPQEELEYLLRFPRFDTSAIDAILGPGWCPEFHEYETVFWKGYDAFLATHSPKFTDKTEPGGTH